MKTSIATWAIAAGLVLSAAGIATAQDSTTTQQQTTTTTTTSNSTGNAQDNSSMPSSATDATMSPSATQSSTLPSTDSATTPPTEATPTSSDNNRGDVRTLTGCLQKGDGTNEYQLTARDGSTWELRSDAVDMASHIGQTVTITGAVRHPDMHNMKEDAKREAQEHGVAKSSTEHGHMTVTDLTMVSNSCS